MGAGYVALRLLLVLWTATAISDLHPLAPDMPTSPEDTGIVPAELVAAMRSPQENFEKENVTDLATSGWTCHGQRRRHFKNHFHVYRMRFASEPSGLKDRNAASLNGIFELLTGGNPSLPKTKRVKIAWGLNRYYEKGVMEITFMSYTKFGTYQSCNALNPGQPGSPHHCSDCAPAKLSGQCCCASWNSTSPPSDDVSLPQAALPGRLKNSYTGGVWYSFNGQGLGSTWHQFECPSATVSVKKLADALAEKGNCGKCRASVPKYGSYFHDCGECIRKIPEHTWQKVFHDLFPSGIFGLGTMDADVSSPSPSAPSQWTNSEISV